MIDDFNVPGLAVAPNKAYPPLIIDANAARPLAVTAQRLQTIARRHTQIVELLGRVDGQQLGAGAPLNLRREIADGVAAKIAPCACRQNF